MAGSPLTPLYLCPELYTRPLKNTYILKPRNPAKRTRRGVSLFSIKFDQEEFYV